MYGLKSAILPIFQKSADWLDWPCPVRAALQNGSQEFFFSYILIFIYFFKYETIVRNTAWLFGHSDTGPGSVNKTTQKLAKCGVLYCGILNIVMVGIDFSWMQLRSSKLIL